MLECKKCGKEKPKKQFYKEPRTKRGYNARCIVCCKADAKAVFQANPEPYRKRSRAQHAKPGHRHARKCKDYGITVEDFDRMLVAQDHKCPICLKQPEQFCIDHCHDTGKVRGLLCHSCNLLLGKAYDSVAILQRAQTYLKKP